MRIRAGQFEAGLGKAYTLQSDTDAGTVHHGEHVLHALLFLTDQITPGTIEVEDTSGIPMDAHLVFDSTAGDLVSRTVKIDFGYDEHGNPAGTCRCVRSTRQDKMDDVVRQIVFTGGDEDLRARDRPAAIRSGLGAGPGETHVRTGLRLGQAHGACPLASQQPGQE